MRRTIAVALLALLSSYWVAADGSLPPRLELQKLTVVYVDCRALVGQQDEPGLLVTPEVSDRFCPAIIKLISQAGIRVSAEPFASLPQLRAWTEIVRNPAVPGMVAVGVEVAFSDVVRLRRLPKVSPVEQGELWRRSGVALVADGRLEQHLAEETTTAVQAFLSEVKCVNDRRCLAGLE